MAKVIEHVTLYFREGSSDKVYKASIEEEKGLYEVNFAYGRRGNTLTGGSKGTGLSLQKANDIYNKLVREKTGKGYVEDRSGKPHVATKVESDDLGIRPQLLNDITEEDVEKYINDPDYCAQEKYDGRRRLLVKDASGNKAGNRKGLVVPITAEIEQELNTKLPNGNYVLDGEAVGDNVIIFDMLAAEIGYKERYDGLRFAMKSPDLKYLKLAPVAWTTEEKRALYEKLKADNAEGIVFKNVYGRFTPGRPNSGGDQLKFKFYATASCIVAGINKTKRSISLAVQIDGEDELLPVGNVTVYPNQEIPAQGSIVEVKYLYYFQGGSLFQPVLLGERDDLDLSDCVVSKLKVKREEPEEVEV